MNARGLRRYVDDLLRGRRPKPFAPDDFEAARRLLAEAGYPGGKGLPPFEVQIKSDDIHRAVLEAIQEMWKRELGLTITITPLEQKTWIQNWQTFSYQVSSSRWIGDYVDPNTFLDMWVTNGGNNETGWSNQRYDELIAAAARENDPEKRFAIFREAEKILVTDEVPICPMYYYVGIQFYDAEKLGGIEANLLDEHPLKTMYWKKR